ncbi:MAG: hypothetical protein A2W90_21950 [Bacteroidetes bacterium GWF2_42_66]|nr:MAG: hypothetical protein A2W92_04765 [Bacteroidetes bacterium GWA2_42_15]OFY03315.1 MAG: hypothetical protein A2W89_18910 [Bacteroidetes bacterium GWE2_42_39]OFY45731.1 MAG: hypothetical protein A2W90_21950 [Bacteroidetes bacterium GWF2_42_66]
MKKHNYIFFIVLLFISAACNKLDENPIGVLAPESFFRNKADAEASIMGAYASMVNIDDYGARYFYLSEPPSDLTIAPYDASLIEISSFDNDPNEMTTGKWWIAVYKIIGAANNAISGIPNIKESDEVKNRLMAEAMAIRAHTYFRLVRIYGDVPYLGEFVNDPATVKDITRTPVAEIYQHIINDLEFAIQHLPNSYSGDTRSRVTKGTAYTILADVYLTLKEWGKAAENAEYVINHATDFGYGLVDDFKDLFDASLNHLKENIWICDFSFVNNSYPYDYNYLGALFSVSGSDYGGWSTFTSNVATLNSFDNRDYRKKISFLTEAPYKGVIKNYTEFGWPLPHINKWYGSLIGTSQEIGYPTDLNVNVYRYAEVLLIASEALNEINSGPTAKAYDYINQVRARARNYGGTMTNFPADLQPGMSQEEFFDAVMEERRVELAFECKRWFDICRRNLFEKVFAGPNSTEPHTTWQKLLPIPQSEIDINPNLTQNPDYN